MRRQARVVIAAIVALIVLGALASSFYTAWLWFQNLQFSSVFLTMEVSKVLIGLAAALVFLLFVGINYYVARLYVKKTHPVMVKRDGSSIEGLPMSDKAVGWTMGAFIIMGGKKGTLLTSLTKY
jgi:uncharacterized membrane protein (UPF0182 family)